MFNKPAPDYLPKLLNYYNNSDSFVRQRAHCLYRYSIALALLTLVIVFKYIFLKLSYNPNLSFNYYVVYIWSVGGVSFLYSLFLLKKGSYKLSFNLVLVTSILIILLTIIFTDAKSGCRIDSVPLVFAAFGIMPLFIEKRKNLIFGNMIVGITFFIIIGFLLSGEFLQKNDLLLGFVINFAFVLFFISFSGHSILFFKDSFINRAFEKSIEQKKAEENLKSEDEFSRRVIENLPIGVGIVNTQEAIVYINPSFTKIFGYTLNEIPDYNTWLEKAYPDPVYRERVSKQWTERLQQARQNPEINYPPEEYVVFSNDGKPKNIEINFSFVGDEVFTTFYDISEVRQGKEKYRSLFENTGTGFVVIEGDGLISLTNNSFVEKLGYTRDELENKVKLTDLIYEEDIILVSDIHRFVLLKNDKQKLYYEFRLKRRDGTIRIYSAYVSGIYGTNKITASLNDITEQKKAQDEIIEKEKRAVAQRAAIANILLNKTSMVDDYQEAMRQIIKIATSTMGTARGSIWWLVENDSILKCETLYEANTNKFSSGATLNPDTFPEYFNSLRLENRIYARDAVNDYRTKALADNYLIPMGISSLLDSCIMTDGKITGIVSFEHIGPLRSWHSDEESFASNIASVLAQFKEKINHRKTELALQDSEERFRSIMEQSPFSMMIILPDGAVQYVNKAFINLWGTDPSLYNNYNLFEDPNLIKFDVIAEIIKVVKGERISLPSTEYDLSDFLGNGIHKYIQSNFYPVKDSNNRIKYIILIHQDVTERVKAEQEVKKNRELFRSLMELNPNSISVVDFEGRYLMVNKAFCKYANLPQEEIIGKTAIELGFSSSADGNIKIIDELYSKGVIENFEITVKQNGREYNLITSASIVEIDGKKEILTTRFDITERKKLEAKLLESENLLRMIVDMVPYSIVIHDKDNLYSFVNRAFLKVHNFELENVIGKTSAELGLIIEEDDYKKVIQELNEKGNIDALEVAISTPNKTKLYFLLSMHPFVINDSPHMIVTTVDITERKELENQLHEYNIQLEDRVKKRTEELAETLYKLQQSNIEQHVINEMLIKQREELEEALKKLNETQEQLIQTEKMASLGILTAGIAHEINNPINYIYNGALAIENFIDEHFPDSSEEFEPLIKAITTGIERTTNIIKSLSKFSRKETSAFTLCRVGDIIEDCLTILYNKYKNRIEIIKDYPPEIPEIMGGEVRLHQAFLNILANAVQAIENDGKIIIKISVESYFINIHLTDTGSGISEENLKHIYDPFFTTKNPGEGTGLGLSITQRIVLEHLGTIQCKSKLTEGTEFIIKLPIKG